MAGKTFTDIKDLEKTILDDLSKMFRGAGISAFNEIVIESPRDTGRFAGNWIATVNEPSSFVSESTEINFNPNIYSNASLNDTLYLTNNLPYGPRLAHGWSGQRPDGWIDSILINGKSGLNKKIKEFVR